MEVGRGMKREVKGEREKRRNEESRSERGGEGKEVF